MMRRRGRVAGMAALAVALLVGRAHAEPQDDAVALLPLDTDRSLEIYGQPVARAIARVLEDGKVQVVVVGAKMAVPERARLIIDGTLAAGKASTVTISLRIRNRTDGKVLDSLSATAPALAKLDVTAAELSARVLPLVRDKLAALHAPVDDRRPPGPQPPPAERHVAIAVVDSTRAARRSELAGALDEAATAWARAHHHQPQKLDPAMLDPKLPTRAVAGGAELAVGFWILAYLPERTTPPMARARVRVQVVDATAVLFDRVVVTDTVLGEKGSTPTVLAARVAREVLAILRPHLARRVPSWR